ncbi:uncharacterized protein LOC143176966 [Calliopsis andreniformis]|uniref:uncharacterized protein LOC143176966 n=1 Tax=Calliopsis andreniformis TaxID=337506 RepID=UPI003FCEC541
MKKRVCSKSEAKLKTVNEQQISDGDEKNFMGEKDTVEHGLIIMDKAMSENNVDKKGASVSTKIKEGEDRSVSYIKQQWSNLPRTSSSVPWIRAKHSFRKKLRGYELKAGRRVEELPAGDGNPTFMIPRSIDTGSTTDQRNGKREIVDGATKTERSRVTREQNEAPNAQEARLVAVQKVDTKMKTTYTQTSAIGTTINEKTSKFNELKTNIDCGPVSYTDSERKRSSAFWNVDEDPAPQWLIEEALNRGTERWRKDEATSNKETEYETIITELEAKLNETRANLEEALRTKSIVKEKYKRTLENAKAEARKENEVLQDRIVRICTSVLENFGPRTMTEKIGNSYQTKICKRSRCHGKISCKLHKKLHMAVTRSNKLKRKLATARRLLKNKSEKCESIGKCFDRLKEKMETTESNLNNLISENLALRKSIEDTRQWMEQSIEKEHHEKINSVHFRDIHRSRELTNLKKKVEESLGTISQLRNKLLRSESANANKGFLLNSYKSQLVDLNTEKKELMSKISDLENEISTVKSSNSQLKAKISVLNIEKDKLLSENEKSKTDVTEKLETKCCTKCEQLREELDSLKAKYMRTMKAMTKLDATETQNKEYSKAIKEFLKKLYEYRSNCETQKNPNESEASEREAHETACNILNMTPEELSGFINGKAPTSINSWVVEFNRIITKASFSESLSKFLFKKAIKKVKT